MNRRSLTRAAVVLFCVLAVASCSSQSSPTDAAQSFLALLKDGKHLEAQDRLSADYKKMVISLGGGIKNEHLKAYYRSANIQSFEVVRVESSGESARAQVRVLTKDGSTHEDEINLVRENGKWLVAEF